MPTAQHPKAASFTRLCLFAGVTSFEELEARIAALPEEQARGNAFEVFAEACLATQRKHDAAKVWPLGSVPSRILQTLGLAAQDYGVDGVFETALGQFSAYQVKFRTGRPALAWRELSTFMGLADSPQIRSRVLFTNCDDLPPVLNERQGFFCIRGSDLDRLEAADFHAIEAWLDDAAFVAPRKQPQPHQTEALDALLPTLETHDRVSAIMACGTGKTLVALWIAEQRQATLILVLVPSLALLRQILHEWLRETSLPGLAYLCVCSDPTVKDGTDAIATPQSDLDFQVSTDAASVRAFLDTPLTGTKIVFSTYQSARVVGAALKVGEAFDLAVFDEAHKTAGREGRNYAFALEDANLPIRKRLFLTATPRHYNPLRKDKEGDAQLVFSMDRPEVYGPQAYRLTFAEAARRGIICGYKVVISVITSEMVTNDLLSRGEVLVNGSAVRARQVANQIALRDAIGKYGVKKVFTFHSTVKSAASFVADGAEGIGTHLAEVGDDVRSLTSKTEASQRLVTSSPTNGFQTFHVNGTMPTARREHEMRDFRVAARAVMSNARCLTEGVDVPAVDMVAFLSPKRSRVDIVQATGRAMRRSPGKTTGYVLIPLYVEVAAGETVESSVARADFEEVWNVLQSLQEQDDVLAGIILAMREERGRTKGFDDKAFREIVEVCGPLVSLDGLRSAITTSCIERLGDTWDERYGQLRLYREQHGHCKVPTEFPENQQLGTWVGSQRQSRKRGRLSPECIQKLDELGFSWTPADEQWEEMYSELVKYKESHGDCNVPIDYLENEELAIWVKNQRSQHQSGFLSTERFQRLNELGVVWNLSDEVWSKMFAALVEYKGKHGNCRIPGNWPENERLRNWVSAQRQAWKTRRLNTDRIQKLEAIGFTWSKQANTPTSKDDGFFSTGDASAQSSTWLEEKWGSVWEQNFTELVAYKREFGDCNVVGNSPANPTLANWVASQRQRKNNGSLRNERIQRLNEIGFVWDLKEVAWTDNFQRLVEYKRQHGDCKVPQKWPENVQLANWVNNQKLARALGKLSDERIRSLDEIGLAWGEQRHTSTESD